MQGQLGSYQELKFQQIASYFHLATGQILEQLPPTKALCNELTSKLSALLCLHHPPVSQIGLIAHKHSNRIRLSMIPNLFQPPRRVLERLPTGHIVHDQRTDRFVITGAFHDIPAISLQAGDVPDGSFDCL
jgi:hypothetical protein